MGRQAAALPRQCARSVAVALSLGACADADGRDWDWSVRPASDRQVSVGSAQVTCTVSGGVFLWSVRNSGARPLSRFEVPQGNCYSQTVPDGWGWSDDGTTFRAWAEHPAAAIMPGASGTFTARVTSSGAFLGTATGSVAFGEGEPLVAVPGLWAAVPGGTASVLLVAASVSALAVLHVALGCRSTETGAQRHS